MLPPDPIDYAKLYSNFNDPINWINCGEKCAPYNEGRVPFCCDTRHAVPSAYQDEWNYLQANSDLWHIWTPVPTKSTQKLFREVPPGQILVECKGHSQCQRSYRSMTCRAFPFFPYITLQGEFLGLSYYWEYEDRCWIISHLDQVSATYRNEFVAAYEHIFVARPQEKETFRYHSSVMRRVFGRKHRAIPLLHRNGNLYKVTPRNGRIRIIRPSDLPCHGPYQVARELAFSDEVESNVPLSL